MADKRFIQASDIQKLQSIYVVYQKGPLTAKAGFPRPPESANEHCLIYASHPAHIEAAKKSKAGIIICTNELFQKTSFDDTPEIAIFSTPSIPAAMATVNPFYDEKSQRWPQGISSKADIHPTAKIGKNVTIGAFSVIGENVKIGDNCRIGPQCTLEKNCQIGEKTILHPQVYIGERCQIGQSCEIHPHTTIGADGFGFVTDPKTNENHKIPQIGIVVIEDHVEIGANCAIDRATIFETRIRKGTKFDNLIHMAHNCDFGKNGLFAAAFATAGSTIIGDNFKCGGTVAVSDHITITDNVTVGGRSTVTKDITEPGAYTGYPIEKFRDGLRTIASLPSLPELRKEVAAIKEKLGLKN